jgi:hypothetical protein
VRERRDKKNYTILTPFYFKYKTLVGNKRHGLVNVDPAFSLIVTLKIRTLNQFMPLDVYIKKSAYLQADYTIFF